MEFWSAFGEYLAEHDPSYTRRTPSKDYWMTFGIGRSGYHLSLSAGGRDHWLKASLVCTTDGDKLAFDFFERHRSEIEAEFGETIEWQRLDSSIAWDIGVRWEGVDPMDRSRWAEYFEWYWDKLQKLRSTFTQRVRGLELQDIQRNMGPDV